MKITSGSASDISQLYQSQTERATQGSANTPASRPVDRTDSVELSSNAQLVQRAAEAANRVDEAHQARLAELKEQVQEDTYQIPLRQLAERMRAEII
jgi:flagellar biosynthesis anti-sigma factor FlgM